MTPQEMLRHEFTRVMMMAPVSDDVIAAVNRRLGATSTKFEHVLLALLDAYANAHVRVHVTDEGDVFYDTSGVHGKVVD
jgi:hypothetical protein